MILLAFINTLFPFNVSLCRYLFKNPQFNFVLAGGEDYADQIELPEDYIVADTPDAKVERFIELFGYLEFNDDDKEVLYDIVNSKGLNADKLKSFKDKLLSESPKGLKDVQPYMDVMLDFIDKVLFATKP